MTESLQTIAQQLLADHKGLLAADESETTAGKRLATIGLENTVENRRQYRNLFFTAPGIEQGISGIILHHETMGQSASDGTPFVQVLQSKGIIPGIKVDGGVEPLEGSPEEKMTIGLHGLDARLADYYTRGARFAKWRAVITIGQNIPTDNCLLENAKALAEYAFLCQKKGIVPVVEPEVLIDGSHDLDMSEVVTTKTLRVLFQELTTRGVDLTGVILKSSMVISGNQCPTQATPEEIAEATIRCFTNAVPKEVPGIVFLSGGQSAMQATVNLNAIAKVNTGPWTISFSYARALQGPALEIWKGKTENIPAAQAEFIKRLQQNVAANQGKYLGE
ncbi:MAG: class I fructose-bisphosphate aldolase [Patescibacteria group bacterium]